MKDIIISLKKEEWQLINALRIKYNNSYNSMLSMQDFISHLFFENLDSILKNQNKKINERNELIDLYGATKEDNMDNVSIDEIDLFKKCGNIEVIINKESV